MIRVVGLVAKYQEPKAAEMVRWLAPWLKQRRKKVLVEDGVVRGAGVSCTKKQLAAKADLIISLGGDGTLLNIAPLVERPDVPILVSTALSARATRGARQMAAKFFQKPLERLRGNTARLVRGGELGRFDAVDNSEGGKTERHNANIQYSYSDDRQSFDAQAWFSYYSFDLFSMNDLLV